MLLLYVLRFVCSDGHENATYIHTCVHKYTYITKHKCTHLHIHTYTCTLTHAHAHAHAHAHTHTHTHTNTLTITCFVD